MPVAKSTKISLRQRIAPMLLSIVLGVTCQQVLAVSLGSELILSYLGDPVEVEIDVLQWEDIAQDLDNVQISLASAEEYETFDLIYLPILQDLSFNIIQPNSRGEVKVLVSTRDPVVEPYIELLLVMRWPGGSLLREYVLLFDLPDTSPPSTVSEVETVTTETQRIDIVSAVAAPIAVEPRVEEPASDPQALSPQDTASNEDTGRQVYQVSSGDILWNIAQQFVPADDTANIYQMLLSLHDLNQAAFINANISLLKANTLLQIPNQQDMAKFDAVNAQKNFEQIWEEGTQRLQAANEEVEFTPLNETPNQSLDADVVPATRVIGEESGALRASNPNSPLLPATTTVVVPIEDEMIAGQVLPVVSSSTSVATTTTSNALNAPPPIAPVISEPGIVPAQAPTTFNPYLERINDSARELESLLEARAMQISRLEEQVVEMRIRMREAEEVVRNLNTAIQSALEYRVARNAEYSRNTTLLGSFALGLLVALLLSIVMILKLLSQIRSQRKILVEDLDEYQVEDDFRAPLESQANVRSEPFMPDDQSSSAIEVQEIESFSFGGAEDVSNEADQLSHQPQEEEAAEDALQKELMDIIDVKQDADSEPHK